MANITFCLIGIVLLIASISAYSQGKRREGRWFRSTVTETVMDHQFVTTLVASSCVKVDPSLPPCRLAKHIGVDFPMEEKRNENMITPTRMLVEDLLGPTTGYPRELEGSSATTEVGWAEYLGLVAPTSTERFTVLHTETFLDPRYVITFSVKGCRPSKLPVENLCPPAPTMTAIEKVIPTSVIHMTNAEVQETVALETVNNLTSSGLSEM